jgi:hypothetical protein
MISSLLVCAEYIAVLLKGKQQPNNFPTDKTVEIANNIIIDLRTTVDKLEKQFLNQKGYRSW